MTTDKPKFIDSKYFVMEMDNWHLLPGAPVEVVREFEQYMEKTRKWLNARRTQALNR